MQVINTSSFGRFWRVSWTITHHFGVSVRFTRLMYLGCIYLSVIDTHRFGRFWPVSWAITHRFRILGRFTLLLNPKVRLCAGHKHSSFWLILACLIGYYSPFRGPGAISLINDPRGAFMCRSSTLAVLADFGAFHGQLLTILGSRCNFND